jgi:phosphoribosylglycinamide formyltransferase-1
MKNIILFSSGKGSNVQAILNAFIRKDDVAFPLIVTNNKSAGVLDIAKTYQIDSMIVNKSVLNSPVIIDNLEQYKPDLIVLAGFLWKIPSFLVEEYENKIVNIHPSLLPKYGGRGMFGKKVHEEVLKNKEVETGMTIHMVNEEYDKGMILLQKTCDVLPTDTIYTLSEKVLAIEHDWYPKVIESLLN